MRGLIHAASELGLRVHAVHMPEGILGYYSPTEQRIYFDLSLTPRERRSVVAHELGHAYHGHDCSTPRNERQADSYAAELLIDPEAYASAENISHDIAYLADELGVTEDLIRHFRKHCLQRLGRRTYATGHNSRLTNELARELTP